MPKNIKFITKNPEAYSYESWSPIEISSDLTQVWDYCKGLETIDFDTETNTLHPFKGGVLLTILGSPDLQFVIDNTSENGYTLNEVFSGIDLSTKSLRGTNLKFDLKFLNHKGIQSPKTIWDVMIAEQTLTKGTGLSCSLDAIVQRRLKENPLQKSVRKEFPLMNNKRAFFYKRHIDYSAEDVEYLERIEETQRGLLSNYAQVNLAYINMQTTIAVAEAETRGVLLDVSSWKQTALKYQNEVIRMEKELDEILIKNGFKGKVRQVAVSIQTDIEGNDTIVRNLNKGNVNFNSLPQMVSAFNQVGWIPPEDSKTGKISFAKEPLADYVVDHAGTEPAKFVALLKEYNVVRKRVNSFGLPFLVHVKNDGAIHAEFSVNRTETGRFSCKSPNLQQIPHTEDFRKPFVAREGYKMLTADYSSCELRILADVSGDKNMMDILAVDGDLHSYVAQHVFRRILDNPDLVIDKEKNNPELRNKIKNVIFSKVYGASVKKTAELLECSMEDAQLAETAMREALPQAFAYLDKVGSMAVKQGYVVFNQILNQRRWFPECFETTLDGKRYRKDLDEYQESSVMRKAMNAPIQGTNGEMIKTALTMFLSKRKKLGWDAYFLMQIHDELVFEVRDDERLEQTCKEIVGMMNDGANKFLTNSVMKTGYSIKDYWAK